MFRIMKKYFNEKRRFLTFPKKVIGVFIEIFWTRKNFEWNSFSPSQWIKSQKLVRIMKKVACEICFKIGAKKKSQKFRNWTLFRNYWTLILINLFSSKPTQRKKRITCNETESSKRVTDHSRGINALH